MLDRDEDMKSTGMRSPYLAKYKVNLKKLKCNMIIIDTGIVNLYISPQEAIRKVCLLYWLLVEFKTIWLYFSDLSSIMSQLTKEALALRSDEGLTLETQVFESLYGGQFTLSTQLKNLLIL